MSHIQSVIQALENSCENLNKASVSSKNCEHVRIKTNYFLLLSKRLDCI